jgi:type VI secretion system FHA domain protein
MFRLKIIKGVEQAEGVKDEVCLPESLTRFSIGRDPANDWEIPDRTLAISARHCEIIATAAGPMLRDLSTNGTFVNGAASRLGADHLLRQGDRIELGPYTVLVQGGNAARAPAAAPRVATPNLPAQPAVRPPGAAAVLRGGDPAAMLAGSGGVAAQDDVTELSSKSLSTGDADLALTKIRLAPRPAPAADPPKTPAAAPKAAAVPAATPAVGALQPAAIDPGAAAQAWLEQLSRGLGLPADALRGRDPAQAASQVGALARAAVTVLRDLLDQQALVRRQIGSRAPALSPVREVNPLRLAATPEAALRDLLAPGANVQAPLQRAVNDLAAHQERLMAAFRAAAARLGDDMAPASLEAALAGSGDADHRLRLWELYTQLWQGIGLAPGQPWSKGFLEAALMHLAAAYDDQAKT